MGKKLLLIPLALLLAISLIAIGCPAEETTTPTTTAPTTTTPTTTTPTTTEPEVYTLVVNDYNPSESTVAVAWDDWAAWVEEESGGRLDIEIVKGGALLADVESFQGTIDGVCDISHYAVDAEQGFLLSLVFSLPFMGWPEQHVEDAFWTLMEEFPEMQAEWDDVMILSMMCMPFTQLHTIDTVVVTPEDIEGLRIIGAEAMTISALDVAGATVADISIMEMTTSLSTGLADGVINHFPVCGIFGTFEFLQCHTVFGGGINMTPMFAIMNKDSFNKLPADLQDILLESSDKWLEFQWGWDDISMENAMAMCEGDTFTYLDADQIAVWRDLVKAAIHDEWIADCEAAGLPGQEVYDRALELVASS